jgi:recombination protein RecT
MSNIVPIDVIRNDIYSTRERFDKMSGGALNFEREAGFAVQIVTASEYAMRIAMDNRQSVVNAVTHDADIGISLNPAKRQAYLGPRDGRICLDISYMGLLDLAIQSGSVMWGQAELVYAADRFELQGFDKPPVHHRDPFAKERGAIVGVYVVVKTRDGDYLTTCMSIDEVYDIRNRSSAWKAWETKQKKCPWVTDEGEMTKKTVIKRAYKLWPKTDRLDNAVHFLNTEGGEGLADIGQPEAQSFRSSATMGVMASLPMDMQTYLRDLADEVTAIVNNPESGVGIAYDRVEAENLDSEQKTALWSCLDSKVRSALKKEGEARRSKAAAPAQGQSLEPA